MTLQHGLETLNLNTDARKECAIHQVGLNEVHIWQKLEPFWYLRRVLTRDAPNTRYSNRRRDLINLLNVFGGGNDWTSTTGAIGFLQTGGSGVSSSYITRVSSFLSNSTASVTLDFESAGGAVWIAYTGRTNAGYCRVDIDGSQDDVILPIPDGADYKGIDTYTAVDLSNAQLVKAADTLTPGSHSITITRTNERNGTSTDNRVYIEAVLVETNLAGLNWYPKTWEPGEAVIDGAERYYAGTVYAARDTGTTGTTPPTHSTGEVSDGTIGWLPAPGGTTFIARSQRISFISETEYAANITINAVTEDFGGQSHTGGTETVTNVTWYVDDVIVRPKDNAVIIGDTIKLIESITWDHSESTDLAAFDFVRVFSGDGQAHYTADIELTASADLPWSYGAMLTGVSWDEMSRVYTDIFANDGTAIDLDTYENDSSTVNLDDSTRMMYLEGTALSRTIRERISYEGDDSYIGRVFAQPNVTGVDASGSGEWSTKLYFGSEPNRSFVAGESIVVNGRHKMELE